MVRRPNRGVRFAKISLIVGLRVADSRGESSGCVWSGGLGAARLSARTNLIVWPRAGIGILAVRRTRRFKRSIRRYYEPHGGAVRSGTERSLVRLETSRRFQTNVDERHVVKRPSAGEYTRSPRERGSPEAGSMAKWTGGIFILRVPMDLYSRRSVNGYF